MRHPERTAILVGTHDLLLSRALMRGFAGSRRIAPVEYGLLNNDAQWVFDGVERLGPGLATSVRLQRMRDAMGTVAPTASLWMSSGEAVAGGGVVDVGDVVGDVRDVRDVGGVGEVGDLARDVVAAHVAGTQTAVVVGSVARARALYRALRVGAPERDVVLVHPYFRAADRRDRVAELGEREVDRIVVGTRALEAAIDFVPRTLLREEGEREVAVAVEVEVGGVEAVEVVGEWDESDLLALFDTAVDSSDLDVAGWVCEPADRMALVAWREWEAGGPSEEEPEAGREELCPVPLDELGSVLDGRAWVRAAGDGGGDYVWRRARAEDLKPGVVMLLDARCGGYLADEGWSPESAEPVQPVVVGPEPPRYVCVVWVTLDQHLAETEEEARLLVEALVGGVGEMGGVGGMGGMSGAGEVGGVGGVDVPERYQEAVFLAARYHDLGKCHEVFQELLRAGGGDAPDGLLAKSKSPFSTGRSRRPHFRHELVSALMLAHGGHWHGESVDHQLVTYLAAAHHGMVRISATAYEDEALAILGVVDGDRTPAVTLSSGETFPAQELRTADFRPESGGLWSAQARALRDRADVGPFRLAFLEALVRVADWRSSARHDGPEAG
ncbi:CRISPR-associated endonuclease Cas3'' [Catenulispora yoronensis]|uniref:CRISPR-associated endonuclease Cas3'' n=1 Tax=Catenulispora yoronensis TaxID=450799 RepID=UPI0031D03706